MKITTSRLAATTAVLVILAVLIAAVGCGGAPPAAPASSGQPTAAAQPASGGQPAAQPAAGGKDSILIGIPIPSTGPLASFGEGSPWAQQRAIDAVNKDGGVMVDGKKLPIKLKFVDTSSDPAKAGEVVSKLILEDKIDLLVALHTPATINPAAAMAEKYQMPTILSDSPIDPWLAGGPYQWSFLSFWTIDQVCDLYISMADRSSSNKTVGYIFPNDADARAWVPIFDKKLAEKGYKVVDAGRFPEGTKDFTALIDKYKQGNVEILMGTLATPDFATAWRQMHQQGWVPKVATIGKAALFPAAAASLGEGLAQGLSIEFWWSPFHPYKSSITGETAKSLAEAWPKENNNRQWLTTLGSKYASMEVAVDVLKRAGTLDKTKLRDAIAKTDLDTMTGKIKYNDKHYSQIPLTGAQWNKGKDFPWELYFIDNSQTPGVQISGPPLPLPK